MRESAVRVGLAVSVGTAVRNEEFRMHLGSPGGASWTGSLRGAAIAASVLLLLGLASGAFGGPAERAYRKGDLEKARRLYEEQLHEEPGDLRARYNLGNVLYRSKQLKAAEEAYQAALPSPDPALRARAAHNLGNARLQAGEIDGAIGAYIEALRAQPGNADTQYNLELALKMRQMKPPEQRQSQSQQKQGGGEKAQQQPQDGQKKGEGQEQQEQAAQPQQGKPPEEQEAQGKQPDAESEKQKGQAQPPPAPGDYSQAEAERVLDGLSQEERDLLADRWRTLGQNVRVEKDW